MATVSVIIFTLLSCLLCHDVSCTEHSVCNLLCDIQTNKDESHTQLQLSHTRTAHIQPLLTLDAAKMVASIVSSRLDDSNAVLYGTSAHNAGGTQLAGQSGVSNSTFRQCYRVTPAAPLVASSPMYHLLRSYCIQAGGHDNARHDLLAFRLTCLISSTDIYQHTHYDRPTNGYCQ